MKMCHPWPMSVSKSPCVKQEITKPFFTPFGNSRHHGNKSCFFEQFHLSRLHYPVNTGRFGLLGNIESFTNLRCQHSPSVLQVNYVMMQNKMWQSKRCLLNTLITHLLLERSHKMKVLHLIPHTSIKNPSD